MSHVTKSPALRPAATPGVKNTAAEATAREVAYRKKLSAGHTAKIVLRNAAYAALGRVLVGILKLLAKRGLSKSFLQRVPGEVFSLDPLKWAAVFGGFSSFRFVMQTVSRFGRYAHLPEKLAALVAGFICSTPALVMNRTTRTELCLYALVRALHTFALRFVYPRLPQTLQDFPHYDVLLMCVSAVQISYGCLFAPSTMPKSYLNFLNRAAMMDGRLMRGHSACMRGLTSPELAEYCLENNIGPFDASSPDAREKICEYIHGGVSCNRYALTFIPRNMVHLGIPLYGPLRVLATLATQRKRLMSHPGKTIMRGAKSVFTSSLFLSLYVACFIRASCYALRNGTRGGGKLALLCFCAGLPTLLEPKGRRMDLALYCAMYALRSFVLTQYRFGNLPYPQHWFVLLTYFSSVAFLFFEYEEEPKLLNPRVHSALRMLLGERAPSKPTTNLRSGDRHSKSRSPALHPKDQKEAVEIQKLSL